jgi:hypothetical protein
MKLEEEESLTMGFLAPSFSLKSAALRRKKIAEMQIYNPIANKQDPKA